jgi:transcriptional regulator with XRE-family HTH domain
MSYRKLIGENIRTLRRAKKWTQEDLAIVARLNSYYISKLERGTINVSLDSLERIAKALGVKLSKLLHGD